jgi:D-alanyl-D-alanine dipeptidase
LALVMLGCHSAERAPTDRLQPSSPPADEPLVDVAAIDPRIVIDLHYATSNNFTGEQLYPVARCLLRARVAERLKRVQDRLSKQGLGLKIWDAYRPLSVQKKMWALVPNEDYVANPAKGSRHNRGCAVDVTLVDSAGHELQMPTAFDTFSPAAHRDYAGGTRTARRNRRTLERAMQAEGFTGLKTEWWHFDAPDWQVYPVLDVPLAAVRPSAPAADYGGQIRLAPFQTCAVFTPFSN